MNSEKAELAMVERWKGTGMLGYVNETEWKKRSQALRQQWLEFIR